MYEQIKFKMTEIELARTAGPEANFRRQLRFADYLDGENLEIHIQSTDGGTRIERVRSADEAVVIASGHDGANDSAILIRPNGIAAPPTIREMRQHASHCQNCAASLRVFQIDFQRKDDPNQAYSCALDAVHGLAPILRSRRALGIGRRDGGGSVTIALAHAPDSDGVMRILREIATAVAAGYGDPSITVTGSTEESPYLTRVYGTGGSSFTCDNDVRRVTVGELVELHRQLVARHAPGLLGLEGMLLICDTEIERSGKEQSYLKAVRRLRGNLRTVRAQRKAVCDVSDHVDAEQIRKFSDLVSVHMRERDQQEAACRLATQDWADESEE